MTDHPVFVFIAMLLFVYRFFSKIAEKSIVIAPMVSVLVGIIVAGFFTFDYPKEGMNAQQIANEH